MFQTFYLHFKRVLHRKISAGVAQSCEDHKLFPQPCDKSFQASILILLYSRRFPMEDSLLFPFTDGKLNQNQHVRYDSVKHLEGIGVEKNLIIFL